MSFRWRFGVGLGVLGAFGAACGGGHMSLPPDESTDLESGGGDVREAENPRPVGAAFPAAAEIQEASASGAIERIAPEARPGGTMATRVVIAGDAEEAQRSFLVMLPDEVPLPFAVGDTVALRIETLPGPPTWQPMDLVVTDADGGLLLMNGVTAPDGWSLEIAGEAASVDRGDYDEVERYVSLTHEGTTAVTDRGRWRRLEAPDGAWFVAGSARDVEGDSLPPDSGPSHAIMIVRGR